MKPFVQFLAVFLLTFLTVPVVYAQDQPREMTSETASEPEVDAPVPAEAPETADPNEFRVFWKQGLNLETANKQFKLKIGGRIQTDWAWFADDNLSGTGLESTPGTEFRRARLYTSGQIYGRYIYKLQYDFASSGPFKDVYIGVKKIKGLGTIKVGHYKEPFSIDEIISSKYMVLMERGLPNTLVPARNTGISFENLYLDEKLYLSVGMFRDTDGIGVATGKKNYAGTGRVASALWQKDGNLIHVGGAASVRKVDGDISYSARPEAHLAEKYLSTGDIATDRLILYNGEVALVYEQLHLTAEYTGALVQAPTGGDDVSFGGFYAQAGLFLTGEQRPYKTSAAAFSRVKPEENFLEDGGLGAWELVTRVSQLDLNDGAVNGGELLNLSFGLNWYMNPNVRLMTNFVLADLDGADPANIVQSRIHVNF